MIITYNQDIVVTSSGSGSGWSAQGAQWPAAARGSLGGGGERLWGAASAGPAAVPFRRSNSGVEPLAESPISSNLYHLMNHVYMNIYEYIWIYMNIYEYVYILVYTCIYLYIHIYFYRTHFSFFRLTSEIHRNVTLESKYRIVISKWETLFTWNDRLKIVYV